MVQYNHMDPYVTLAKNTIRAFVTAKTVPEYTEVPSELLNKKAGVFVSLHRKSDHSLRGCIGTFLPTKETIAEEIINNAVAAATEDPRFDPISKKELADLEINVDVLSEPEQTNDMEKLNPKKYGLIVKNQAGHTGLLLPDIGVATVDEQITICCDKGGINPQTDKLSLFRFTVERHK
jgi:AmmeMemoRadiSam system protein A